MRVKNETSFRVIVSIYHSTRGCGNDASIEPGEEVDVHGPEIGIIDGEVRFLQVYGEINCHSNESLVNKGQGFYVSEGEPILLGKPSHQIFIRHYLDNKPDIGFPFI